MATDRCASQQPPEDDMLPDEREVIAERASDLDELEEDEYLTTNDLADSLGIDLE
ncbi:hypothetical protein [Natrinema pallidum]|uniref:hypothetical protein n=1 Tax=Natrinema pallidum TaxID=69527 RepID=UPI003752EBAE